MLSGYRKSARLRTKWCTSGGLVQYTELVNKSNTVLVYSRSAFGYLDPPNRMELVNCIQSHLLLVPQTLNSTCTTIARSCKMTIENANVTDDKPCLNDSGSISAPYISQVYPELSLVTSGTVLCLASILDWAAEDVELELLLDLVEVLALFGTESLGDRSRGLSGVWSRVGGEVAGCV